MDEVVEAIFENNTYKNGTVHETMPIHLFVYEGFFIIAAIIGIAADALIIHMIASNKKMRTNHNLILMNFAIADALTLFSVILNTKFTLRLLHIPMDSKKTFCMIIDLDSIFLIIVIMFVFALISKTSFQYTLRVNLINMAVFYSVMLAILIVCIITCQMNYNFMLLPLAAVLMYLGLIVTVIIKENVWRCCCKIETLSKEMLLRMNVARIYTYCGLISGICFFFIEITELDHSVKGYLQFVHVIGYLTSCFILAYLAYADKKFQICLLNVFRKEENKYNIDATIGFSEEDEPRDGDDELRDGDADLESDTRPQSG